MATAPLNLLPAGVEIVTPPPIVADPSLCAVCGVGKRAGSGLLTRCMGCIKADAQRARDAGAAARARVAATVGASKTCRTCQRSKPLVEFGTHARSKDGHRRDCRKCVATGKAERNKPLTAEQKIRDRARRQTAHYRAKNLAAAVAWQTRNADAVAARNAVGAAKKAGTLVPPRSCQAEGCRKRRQLHAHHNSYTARNRLRVAWLCGSHHRTVHAGLKLKLKAGAAFKTAVAPTTA
jgi:hypothetical protein